MSSRPQPVLTAGTLSGIVAAVVALLGIKLTDDLNAAVDAVIVAIPLVVSVVTAWIARSKVTPLSAPQAADGTPLVKP